MLATELIVLFGKSSIGGMNRQIQIAPLAERLSQIRATQPNRTDRYNPQCPAAGPWRTTSLRGQEARGSQCLDAASFARFDAGNAMQRGARVLELASENERIRQMC